MQIQPNDQSKSGSQELELPNFKNTLKEKEIRDSLRNFNAKCIDEKGSEYLHNETGFEECLDKYRDQEYNNKPKKIQFLKGQ